MAKGKNPRKEKKKPKTKKNKKEKKWTEKLNGLIQPKDMDLLQ